MVFFLICVTHLKEWLIGVGSYQKRAVTGLRKLLKIINYLIIYLSLIVDVKIACRQLNE